MASKRFIDLVDQIKDLHERKNAGYAGKDAVDPWANFRMAEMMDISAFQGCLVRMSDKFIRVANLSKDLQNDQVGESITDTLLDLAVYSLIAICLCEEDAERKAFDEALLYRHDIESDLPIIRGRIINPEITDRLDVEFTILDPKEDTRVVDWDKIRKDMDNIVEKYIMEAEQAYRNNMND